MDRTPVQMDLIIAGTDPVATDATAVRIMGFNPHERKHIRKAYEKGLGHGDAQVVGEKLEIVKRMLKRK